MYSSSVQALALLWVYSPFLPCSGLWGLRLNSLEPGPPPSPPGLHALGGALWLAADSISFFLVEVCPGACRLAEASASFGDWPSLGGLLGQDGAGPGGRMGVASSCANLPNPWVPALLTPRWSGIGGATAFLANYPGRLAFSPLKHSQLAINHEGGAKKNGTQ